MRSTDNGTNWGNATVPATLSSYRVWGAGFGNNTFVGTTHWGEIVRSTDDGSSFSYVTDGDCSHMNGIYFGNNTFVAVCYGGKMERSTDNGTTWDNITSGTTEHLYGVAF